MFAYKEKHPDLLKFYDKDLKFLKQFDKNHDEKAFILHKEVRFVMKSFG
jgi:hypothetical protein